MSLLVTGSGRLRLGWRVLLFLSLTGAGTILFSALFSALVPGQLPWAAFPLLVGSLAAGWILLAMDGRKPGALGFHPGPEALRESLLGLGLGILVAGSVVVGLVALGALSWSVEGGTGHGYLERAAESLWLLAFPAAGEEALMRGYLLQALAEAWGGGWALLVTSILFGLLHLGNPNTTGIGLANILLAGVFLGLVYLKTLSLWWATGAHLGWNWAHGFLADLPVSGLELMDAPLVEASLRGPPWLSGGPFGPEGSVVTTLMLVIWIVILWTTAWLRPGRTASESRPLCASSLT